MKIAFLVAPEGVEQVELTEPWRELSAAGHSPRLVSTEAGKIQAFDHLDKADTFDVDQTVADATVTEYDALILPGGVANPDFLRLQPDAVAFAKGFCNAGKPVAAICHAPWLLVEAGVVRGRTLTSFPSLGTDIRNAGGTWVDEQVHVCDAGPGPLITSRRPGDLKAFDEAILNRLSGAAA
ncbi:type 1 glutamine amidotransferase domain-containing protein [Streptomyces meridianus]|uniref:Type 1 glutamine amidotransferase n=1 Tax=Streptomyces meridianus TaxID=2938945 RepID=A0ABT0XDM5_9ACTN|nr:type 1 glutamine amidotransferase domain-containing protein [Streptomyces meridianus]MCM2580627.1 type 1 glutamine amidotransferase [Streptomyces meridianus]